MGAPASLDPAWLASIRAAIRAANGGLGQCERVSEATEERLGWPAEHGILLTLAGLPCVNHAWNRTPDGGMLDATSDQFGPEWPSPVLSFPSMGRAAVLLLASALLAACALDTNPPGFPSPSPTGYTKLILADKPSGYWLMDAQDAIADISGHSHNAAVTGGTELISSHILGKSQALLLDSQAAVTIPSGVGLGPHTTLEFWIQVPQAGSVHIARSASGSQAVFRFVDVYLDTNAVWNVDDFSASTTLSVKAPSAFLAATWHYLAYTDDGSSATLWVDGAKVASGQASSAALDPGDFYFGGGGGGAKFALDEGALYAYVLSPQQIASHWHAGCAC